MGGGGTYIGGSGGRAGRAKTGASFSWFSLLERFSLFVFYGRMSLVGCCDFYIKNDSHPSNSYTLQGFVYIL